MTENNKQNNALSKPIDFGLTERNWLMLKEIEKGKSVKDAYFAVGYKGEDRNAPYQLYYKLKKKLELVYEADNVDSLRLKIEAKKILDMPVDQKPIKPETKLKALETLHKLSDKEPSEKKGISPFMVIKADSVNVDKKEIVEIKEPKIEESDEKIA